MPRRSTEESIRESIRPPLHDARSRPPTDPELSPRWADEGIRRWHHNDRPERIPHLSCVEPVAKRRLRTGAVVWAHVPFRELDDDKTRPAVVQETRGRVVTVLAGSSSLTRRRYPDLYVELSDLAAAGLRRPTGVRRAVLFAVDLSDVLSITGELGAQDMASVFERLPRATRISPRIPGPLSLY
ncbi:MAG: hypothetical protein M0Z30_08245 [Actinomycetota bacterium]|nr:hypothetical protein [Actinomycetota bacterium]